MAVALILDFKDATLDQYDQVIEKMGLTGGSTPPGALFHWVAKTDGGILICDVWERQEDFQAFAETAIGRRSPGSGGR